MTWSRDLTSVSGFISPCENVSLACYYLQLDCGPVPQVTSNNKQTNIAASPEEPLLISVVSVTVRRSALWGSAEPPPPLRRRRAVPSPRNAKNSTPAQLLALSRDVDLALAASLTLE